MSLIRDSFPVTSALVPQAIQNAPGAIENAFTTNAANAVTAAREAVSNGHLNYNNLNYLDGLASQPINANNFGHHLSTVAGGQSLNATDDAARVLNNLHRMGDNVQGFQQAHTTAAGMADDMSNAMTNANPLTTSMPVGASPPLWARAFAWLNGTSRHATSAGQGLVRSGWAIREGVENTSGFRAAAQNAWGTAKVATGNVLQRIPRAAWIGGIIEGIFQIGDMKDAMVESGRENNGRIVAQTARSATKMAGAVGVSWASMAAGTAVAAKCAGIGAAIGTAIPIPGVGTAVGALAGLAVGIGVSWLGMNAVNTVADGLFGKNQVELARENGVPQQQTATTTAPTVAPQATAPTANIYANPDAAMYAQLGFTPEEIAILAA